MLGSTGVLFELIRGVWRPFGRRLACLPPMHRFVPFGQQAVLELGQRSLSISRKLIEALSRVTDT